MKIFPRRLVDQLGWVSASHIAGQGFRLFTNVILARLLAPQLFGIMVIVNTMRTGIELLSDIGIAQNVVSDRKGAESNFYNTAWTIQILRGILLFLVALALTVPIASFYESDQLRIIFPAVSILFILTGVASPSRFILQKNQDVRTLAIWDVLHASMSFAVHVTLAWIWPTIWALVLGTIISTFLSTAFTFFMIRPFPLKMMIDRKYAWRILSFGKWIFASSIIYFIAVNFDRLYFAKTIPFALLGIYGVAKTFSEAVDSLNQRVGNLIIFPNIVKSIELGLPLRDSIISLRRYALLGVAVGLSFIIAISDLIIVLLYDDRYIAAAFMLPILMMGVWFSILATIGDAIMLGMRHPEQNMRANFVKLVWICLALPLAMLKFGFTGALLVIASGDFMRYLSLEISLRSKNLLFFRQDFFLSLLLIGLVVCWRLLLIKAGLVEGWDVWFSYGAALR